MENTNNTQSTRMGVTLMFTYERDNTSSYDEVCAHIQTALHEKIDELRNSHNVRGTIETAVIVPRLADSGVHLIDLGFISILDLQQYLRYGLPNVKGYEELYRELNLAGHSPDVHLRINNPARLSKLLKKYRRSLREDGMQKIMTSICEQIIKDIRGKYEDGLLEQPDNSDDSMIPNYY